MSLYTPSTRIPFGATFPVQTLHQICRKLLFFSIFVYYLSCLLLNGVFLCYLILISLLSKFCLSNQNETSIPIKHFTKSAINLLDLPVLNKYNIKSYHHNKALCANSFWGQIESVRTHPTRTLFIYTPSNVAVLHTCSFCSVWQIRRTTK